MTVYAKMTTLSKLTNFNMTSCKIEAVQNNLMFEL